MKVQLFGPFRWYCPNCEVKNTTLDGKPRFHQCRGLKGLQAPMILEGTKAKVEARDREDYVGNEVVQTDAEGRPVMSVVTTRDEGTDCIVFAPTAKAGVHND